MKYWIIDSETNNFANAQTRHAAEKICKRLNARVGYERYHVMSYGAPDTEVANPAKNAFRYKRFGVYWNADEQEYDIYTPDEMEQPKQYRYPEISVSTEQQAKDFIDSYNEAVNPAIYIAPARKTTLSDLSACEHHSKVIAQELDLCARLVQNEKYLTGTKNQFYENQDWSAVSHQVYKIKLELHDIVEQLRSLRKLELSNLKS